MLCKSGKTKTIGSYEWAHYSNSNHNYNYNSDIPNSQEAVVLFQPEELSTLVFDAGRALLLRQAVF